MHTSYYLTRSVLLFGMAAFFVVLGGTLGNGIDRAYQLQAQTTGNIPSTTLSETECYVLFEQSPESPPATMPAECEQYVDAYYGVPLTKSECVALFDQSPESPPSDLPQECAQYVEEYYYTPLTKDQCYELFDQSPEGPPSDIPTECEVYVDTYYLSVTADPVSEADCYALFDELGVTAQDDTSGFGDCAQYLDRYFESKRYTGSAPACPFAPDTDITIVDYTEYGARTLEELVLRADGAEADATVAIDAYLSPGLYSVSFASYDAHRTYNAPDSYNEQWKVLFYYENGERGVVTPMSRDIGSTEELVKERVATNLEVPQTVTHMIAQHAAFPSNVPHRFVPLCAQFKRTGDLAVEPEQEAPTTEALTDTTAAETNTNISTRDDTEYSTVSTPTETAVTSSTGDTTNIETDATPIATDGSSTNTAFRYERCPIPAQEGRIVVDRTKGGAVSVEELALSNAGSPPRSATYVLPGEYTVTAATFVDAAQDSRGSWRTELSDANGVPVGVTEPVAAGASRLVQVSTASRVVVSGLAVRALSRRASEVQGTVAPLCIAFDRVRTTAPPSADANATDETDAAAREQLTTPLPAETDTTPTAERAAIQPDTSVRGAGATGVGTETMLEGGTPTATGNEDLVDVPQDAGRAAPLQEEGGERDQVTARTIADASPRTRIEQVRARVAETGDAVAVSQLETLPSIRPLAPRPPESSPIAVENERVMLQARTPTEAIQDTDGDGVIDHDEIHLYDTDPYSAYTAGGALSDGERIVLGLDPHVPELVPVAVESAREKEPVLPELFRVDDIAVVEAGGAALSQGTEQGTKALRVRGMAPPNSFVTLYLYSTPIVVTVRTDGEGRFDYVLDETLEDGSHTLYVATVNERGSIVAQSQPIPFVQTAEAVSYTPLGADSDPVERVTPIVIVLMILLLLTTVAGALIGIGMMHAREEPASV